jgi:hypothetical protein
VVKTSKFRARCTVYSCTSKKMLVLEWGEKKVQHQARKYGETKFGMERFMRFLDPNHLVLSRFGKDPCIYLDYGFIDVHYWTTVCRLHWRTKNYIICITTLQFSFWQSMVLHHDHNGFRYNCFSWIFWVK